MSLGVPVSKRASALFTLGVRPRQIALKINRSATDKSAPTYELYKDTYFEP